MASNNSTNTIVYQILGKLSYRAFQALVYISEMFVHCKKPKVQVCLETKNRTKFMKEMLQIMLNEVYDEDTLLWSYNMLVADIRIRRELHKYYLVTYGS
jgi:hypothetical protein